MAATEPDLPPVIVLSDPSQPWPVPALWQVHEGFDVQGQPWDLRDRQLICHGSIADDVSAAAAVTALTRGVGLAVFLAVTDDLRFRLLEDLHQMGTVIDAGAAGIGGEARLDGLDDEHRRLIGALVAGATVTGAARQLNMSRRTAGRRLIEIRAAMGVDSTAEAVSRWAEQH